MTKKCEICKEELFQQENHFRLVDNLGVVCMNCFEQDKELKVFPVTITPTEEWDLFCCEHGMQT